MDQVSTGKFQNHRKNNKARTIMGDKRKGSNLNLEECQLSGWEIEKTHKKTLGWNNQKILRKLESVINGSYGKSWFSDEGSNNGQLVECCSEVKKDGE